MENSLPNGWISGRLIDLCSKPQYGWTSKGGKVGSIKYLRTTDISNGTLNWDNVPYCVEEPGDVSKYQIEKNDILVSRAGSVGLSFRIKENVSFKAAFASYLIRFKPFSEITSKYLEYFFSSKEYWDQLTEFTAGIAIPNVNATKLEQLIIPLAPFEEQKRIVYKLDAILQKVKNSQARLERIPLLLKNMRQSILAAAVSGLLTKEWREKNKDVKFAQVLLNKIKQTKKQQYSINPDFKDLNDLPTIWKWTALGNYANCSRGRFSIRPRNDPKYFTGNYPFIQIGDLPREGGYITAHTQTLNNEGLKVSKLFKEGTVVIAIVGATIGNSGILSYDMCFTDSIVGIETDVDFSNIYVEYYLRSEKENIRQLSYASGGQPNINLETINTYPFPLPPLEEQKEIVRKVEELFAFTDTIETRYEKAKAYFDKIPQAILSKAFKGELVKQDENDEPASELLKRIKQEKQATIKPKTKQPAKRYKMHEGEDEVSMVAEGD